MLDGKVCPIFQDASNGAAQLKPRPRRADVSRMKTATKFLATLARDDRGGEVLEYALVAGLIVIAAIAVIGSVGTKVLARWTSVDASM